MSNTDANDTDSTSELALIGQQSGLEPTRLESLLSRFGEGYIAAKNALQVAEGIIVTDVSQAQLMEEARVARLELKSIRVGVEHTRKDLKASIVREGKAIDGMANIIKAMIEPAEEYLETQEKFAENVAKELKARRDVERLSQLEKLTDVPSMYAYQSMDDTAFQQLLVQLNEAKQAIQLAKETAERERLATEKKAQAEQERIRKENAKLRAEAKAREEAIAKERAAVQKQLDDERRAREAAEQAETERKAAEAKQIAAAEAAKRTALLAPDKDKLLAYADTIDALEAPTIADEAAKLILSETIGFLKRVSQNVRTKAQQLA